MPFIPIRKPQRGSIDQAARRIYEILESEDREKSGLRSRFRIRQADVASGAASQTRDTTDGSVTDQNAIPRSRSGISEQRAEQLDHRRARSGMQTVSQPEPPIEYGFGDWLSDQLSGVSADDYENYVGAKAAISEMVGSQLPGRERGPADAYRHLLWAAELTRRFGEQRAREILGMHEQAGDLQGNQTPDEEAMDLHNNEIGVSIGRFARNWQDVVSAARKVISGSVPDGSGAWQPGYDRTSTLAPYGAQWLAEQRWAKNPRAQIQQPLPGRHPPVLPPQLPTVQTNWYTNPNRPSGPDWVGGYVPDGYKYPFALPANAVGPNDPQVRRAVGAYKAYLDRLR